MAAAYADDARLLELYPELGVYAEADRLVWLEAAKGIVFAEMFGDVLDQAHAAMTGHLLDDAKKKAGGGKATSKSLGPASYTYATAPVSEELQETKYGRHFLLYQRSRIAASVVVVTA